MRRCSFSSCPSAAAQGGSPRPPGRGQRARRGPFSTKEPSGQSAETGRRPSRRSSGRRRCALTPSPPTTSGTASARSDATPAHARRSAKPSPRTLRTAEWSSRTHWRPPRRGIWRRSSGEIARAVIGVSPLASVTRMTSSRVRRATRSPKSAIPNERPGPCGLKNVSREAYASSLPVGRSCFRSARATRGGGAPS